MHHFTQEHYGVGIHKGNTGLAQQINAAIKEMVSSGAWQKAVEDNTSVTGSLR